ncbi:MAG: choice-of-anchor X domain-containing protein, partial [Candidatus Hydrogenedens sp.]
MKVINISALISIGIILLLCCSACRTIAGQPSIKTAEIIPVEISPGENAIIQTVIKDKHHLIQKVEAVIKEDPRIKLKLRDDGVEPDKKANDGIWVLKVDVPQEAPLGNYKLEIMTY